MRAFNGGEGIAYYNGEIIISTKGDNRVWFYDTKHQTVGILYDVKESLTLILTGVAFSPDGKRLYFSSQRGTTGLSENGVSYEIQGF